jgi:ATP adenylyltransferase
MQVRAREALASGDLLSIPTSSELLSEQGLQFVVRVVENLERKDADRRRRAGMADPTAGAARRSESDPGGERPARPNPFLPYDEALYVGDLSATHVALLNKFNVVDHHLLIVTRAFEHQDRLLTEADFAALCRGLREVDGLGFYNGGEIAGASQPHKHLQLVPLPLAEKGPPIPLEAALAPRGAPGELKRSPRLPFVHSRVGLPAGFEAAADAPARLLGWYRAQLEAVGRPVFRGPHGATVDPYNLLVTRRWMLLVPRIAECFEHISLNALAFAGSLLVRRPAQVDLLRRRGCLAALAEVAGTCMPNSSH